MRIAIVNWTERKVGGAESYLDLVIGQLHCAGHEIAFFCEADLPANREQIRIPQGVPVWCASRLGTDQAIGALADWRADVIYGHGLTRPELEARTVRIAPAVCFSHGYRGLCISGLKTFKYPVPRSCSRPFGWQCLAHFYPHRCGGLSPATMLADFRRQSRWLKVLRMYRAIVTASEYMRLEHLRNGFSPQAVKVVPLPVEGPVLDTVASDASAAPVCIHPGVDQAEPVAPLDGLPANETPPYRLLFAGRMEFLKGGTVLLDTLPLVAASLRRGVELTFVGEGPERQKWETKAAVIKSRQPSLHIKFTGWLKPAQLERVIGASDLLIVPSLWPEPFGLVGPEVGLRSLPVAGFAVGGIPEWLIDGVNGYLAPGDPPTPAGLAQAIIKCLRDPEVHGQLRQGALATARRFRMVDHINRLSKLFDDVSRSAGSPQHCEAVVG